MKYLFKTLHTGLLSAAIASAILPMSVAAQEMDHSKMQMPRPPQTPVPAKKPAAPKPAMDHSKMPMPATPQAPAPVKKSATPEPEMDHSAMGHDTSKPADKQQMEDMDHSAMGHDMPMPAAQDAMEGMDHSKMADMKGVPRMRQAPTEPLTPIPVLTDADRAAAVPPTHGHMVHDDSIKSYILFNRLEAWNADPGTGMAWEGQAWFGTDLNRLWLRSEGERVDGNTESADLEVLYGRSIARWWDLVAGVRHDFKPGASQDFVAIGVMGLAPQKFEVEATAYLGERGQMSARFEAEYELLLTNRLVLQPLVEANFYGKNNPLRGIGSGLNTVELGFRLRYEVIREFAPYIGIVRERAFGRTADFRRGEGEDIDDTRIVAGFRIWF